MKLLGGVLFAVGIIWAIAFVPVMFLGSAYPTAGLIAPLVCGDGAFELVSETTVSQNTRRTNVSTVMTCVHPETGEQRELTSILLIFATVPAVLLGVIGIALLGAANTLGGFGNMKEAAEIAKVPEVKARLDALLEDFQAGRISYEEYLAKYKTVIADYKARQAAPTSGA